MLVFWSSYVSRDRDACTLGCNLLLGDQWRRQSKHPVFNYILSESQRNQYSRFQAAEWCKYPLEYVRDFRICMLDAEMDPDAIEVVSFILDLEKKPHINMYYLSSNPFVSNSLRRSSRPSPSTLMYSLKSLQFLPWNLTLWFQPFSAYSVSSFDMR